jgi:hypothetical protein
MRDVSGMATRTDARRGDRRKKVVRKRLSQINDTLFGTVQGQCIGRREQAAARETSTRGQLCPSASPAAHIGEERVEAWANEFWRR